MLITAAYACTRPSVPYRNELTPVSSPVSTICQVGFSITAEGLSQRGLIELQGMKGRERRELHLFNLYFLCPLLVYTNIFCYPHGAHSSCLCCPPPSPLQVGHTSWVRQRLKQGPLGVVVEYCWLSEHSCICMCVCVLVVRFINSTANHCIVPSPL